VGLNPSRTAIIDVLRSMGADIEVVPGAPTGPEPVGDIVVRGGRRLRAVTLAGAAVADLIDELPVLSIAMASAEGTSEVRDAGELRVKESDRIRLVVNGLTAIGAHASELEDGWRVTPGTARDASVVTDGDHRIAMAFGLAAVTGIAGTVTLDDGDCVDVSYNGFWEDLAALAGGTVTERIEGNAA
jgi:3-phosphoshikimate 1-carboxyvinyltransferase